MCPPPRSLRAHAPLATHAHRISNAPFALTDPFALLCSYADCRRRGNRRCVSSHCKSHCRTVGIHRCAVKGHKSLCSSVRLRDTSSVTLPSGDQPDSTPRSQVSTQKVAVTTLNCGLVLVADAVLRPGIVLLFSQHRHPRSRVSVTPFGARRCPLHPLLPRRP